MPKAPILTRTLLYDRLRDGSIMFLDWCFVGTSLGMMVEARTVLRNGFSVNEDPYDTNATDLLPFSRDQLFSTVNSGGDLMPRTYNTL